MLDAGFVVMERNGYTDAAVADILREAESVDALLLPALRVEGSAPVCALPQGRGLGGGAPHRQGRGCSKPASALDAWIDEILSFGYHRAKAARLDVLGSPGAMKAEGYAAETRRAAKLLMAPLETLLATGAADGTFPLADPAADAPLIQSAVWAAAGLAPIRDTPANVAEAARHVRSFCERALGAAGPHDVESMPRHGVPGSEANGS